MGGDPLDETTELAPLSSHNAAVELQKQVEIAIAHGAKVLVAGGIVAGQGNFFKPVVLTDITPATQPIIRNFSAQWHKFLLRKTMQQLWL